MHAKASALKRKVADKVGHALSAVPRARQSVRRERFKSEAGIMKKARGFKGAPDFENGRPTEAFKYRSQADDIRKKYKNGVK